MGIGIFEMLIMMCMVLVAFLLLIAAPIAIIMAVMSAKRRSNVSTPTDHKRAPCPHCKSLVLLTEAVCPHCHKQVA